MRVRTSKMILICASLAVAAAVTACNLINHHEPDINPSAPTITLQPEDKDVSKYAELCRQELGFVGVNIPPLNCLDGGEVPLEIDGKSPSEEQYKLLSEGKIGCDNPSWLHEAGCINYNFVLHRAVNDSVDLALVCRSRHYTSLKNKQSRLAAYSADSSVANFKALFYFDSLGIIVSNKKTGKTCFFDQVDPVYGGFIPFPDRREAPSIEELPLPRPSGEAALDAAIKWEVLDVTPQKTWKKPYQMAVVDRCTICHDSGPWKHTPWIPDGVKIPPNPTGVPLIVIGPIFEEWRVMFEPTAITTDPVVINGRSESQLCTACHRIGRESTCKVFMDYAAGLKNPSLMSKQGLEPHRRRTMPPQTNETKSMNDADFIKDWDTRFKPHFDALKRCCDNPKLPGCRTEPFGR